MIFKTRRSYSSPASYLLGGGALEGLDTSAPTAPDPARAVYADNLWREADGCVCKRPGFSLLQQTDIPGRVQWMREFEGAKFYYYVGENGGVLRRVRRSMVQERTLNNARSLLLGEKLFIFAENAWIVAGDNTFLLTPQGSALLDNDLNATVRPWGIDDRVVPVPLTHAGGRPGKQGQGVSAPNLLVPLVQESFVYTKSDSEAKRNRFCLSFSPVVKGALPTNADGTHDDLSAQDSAVRVATMTASARLEVRREKTDAYGNTVSFWSTLLWSAADNINSADAAFWVQGIHLLDLCYDGDDNVRITYFRPETEDTAKLYSAKAFELFGVGGLKDRLFAASGNRVYYSGMDNPLYFGFLQYLDFGEEIVMMGGEGNVLTVLSDESAWQVRGSAESRAGEYVLDAYFSISARFPSPRPYGECIVAGNELLFYSERGVCAVAPSGVLDERNVQLRSERLWGLLREEDPAVIRMGVWKDMLFLAGEKGIYLLDLRRRVKSEEPYSSHGYEGYFWSITGVESFVSGEELRFFKDGQMYALNQGVYHDEVLVDGSLEERAIQAVWETPPLGDRMRCGTFIGLILSVASPTFLKVSVSDRSEKWRLLSDYDGSLQRFCYGTVYYGRFCYGSLWGGVLRKPMKLFHRRTMRLRFENDVFDSPLRLRSFAVEYK